MRKIHYKSNNAYLGMASFESMSEDTLYFLQMPDYVFVGLNTPIEGNVNVMNCQLRNIPVVRSAILGRSYLFEAGKNLWIGLASKEQIEEAILQEILIDALKNIGVEATIRINDILFGVQQLGMTAPSLKIPGGFMVAGQITFDADFQKVEECLVMPNDKWVDKAPATNIGDWILPLSKLTPTTINQFVEAVTVSTAKILNIDIKDGQFNQEELAEMTRLKGEYMSNDWLNPIGHFGHLRPGLY